MQARSAQYDATVKQSGNTHVFVVNVIQDGKIVRQLPVHSANVKADRMAANMRTAECEVSDPDGTLTPVDMNSLLAPFGSGIQMLKGVRNESVSTESVLYNTAASWVPSGQSTGQFNGTKVSATGSLTLGP